MAYKGDRAQPVTISRRWYHRQYWLEHKGKPTEPKLQPKPKEPCPGCGEPKGLDAAHCKPCAMRIRRGKKLNRTQQPHTPTPLACPYCDGVEMQERRWRGARFWRCGGCGLELTEAELRRIHLREAA